MKINDEVKCLHPLSRCSNPAWHHINKNAIVPIMICYDCSSILDRDDTITLFTKNVEGKYIKC
jgi:hypothetical protein